MTERINLKGRSIVRGVAQGEALVTTQPFMFPHGVNPKTGEIIDERHELKGKNLRGKVFVFPYGIGSTTGGTWVLETIRCGNAPLAMINVETEAIIATGVVLAEMIYDKAIPVVDRLERKPTDIIETGDWVKVDGNTGIVEITKMVKPS